MLDAMTGLPIESRGTARTTSTTMAPMPTRKHLSNDAYDDRPGPFPACRVAIALHKRAGFRIVGTYDLHSMFDGENLFGDGAGGLRGHPLFVREESEKGTADG